MEYERRLMSAEGRLISCTKGTGKKWSYLGVGFEGLYDLCCCFTLMCRACCYAAGNKYAFEDIL